MVAVELISCQYAAVPTAQPWPEVPRALGSPTSPLNNILPARQGAGAAQPCLNHAQFLGPAAGCPAQLQSLHSAMTRVFYLLVPCWPLLGPAARSMPTAPRCCWLPCRSILLLELLGGAGTPRDTSLGAGLGAPHTGRHLCTQLHRT